MKADLFLINTWLQPGAEEHRLRSRFQRLWGRSPTRIKLLKQLHASPRLNTGLKTGVTESQFRGVSRK